MFIPSCHNCYYNCFSDVKEKYDFYCDCWEFYLDRLPDMC